MEQMQGMEWREWQQHRQTKEFLKLLLQSVQAIQEDWSNKAFVTDDQYKASMLNAAALGKLDALQDITRAIENITGESE